MLTPGEWATWVLLGDPCLPCPTPLLPLHFRIASAVTQASHQAKEKADKVSIREMESVKGL